MVDSQKEPDVEVEVGVEQVQMNDATYDSSAVFIYPVATLLLCTT